jgi:hypothetical protein
MLKELTKLSTDAALQISAKKTNVMTKRAEIEINLSGEVLEYISEFTYPGQLIFGYYSKRKSEEEMEQVKEFRTTDIRILLQNEIRRRNGMSWNKLKRQRMPSWSPACCKSRYSYTAPNVVAHGEGKEDTPNLSVED